MICSSCGGYYPPGGACTCQSDYKDLFPKYEPVIKMEPLFGADDSPLPKYEPTPCRSLFPQPDSPIRTVDGDLFGHYNHGTNTIMPADGGLPLNVIGGSVLGRDGGMMGELTPGGTILPPPDFGPPEFEPDF